MSARHTLTSGSSPAPSPSKHVGITEVGTMLGVSKQRASQIVNSDGFPAPADELAQGRIWTRRKVEAWARKHRPGAVPFCHCTNDALERGESCASPNCPNRVAAVQGTRRP